MVFQWNLEFLSSPLIAIGKIASLLSVTSFISLSLFQRKRDLSATWKCELVMHVQIRLKNFNLMAWLCSPRLWLSIKSSISFKNNTSLDAFVIGQKRRSPSKIYIYNYSTCLINAASLSKNYLMQEESWEWYIASEWVLCSGISAFYRKCLCSSFKGT